MKTQREKLYITVIETFEALIVYKPIASYKIMTRDYPIKKRCLVIL